jgi:two-component system NtrC family sensor kinase
MAINTGLSTVQPANTLCASAFTFEAVLEALPHRAFLKDPNSVYICCNTLYAHDRGISPEQIAGKTDYDFYPGELAEAYIADDREVILSGNMRQIEEAYLSDGQQKTVHTVKALVKDEDGSAVGVLGIFWDITDQKRAEQELRRSEERWRCLVQATSSSVWSRDPEGKFVVPQPSWQAHTGQGWPAHSGWGWLEMVHPEDRERIEALWQQALVAKTVYQAEARLWCAATEQYRYVVSRAAPRLDPDGSVIEWVGTTTDIDEWKQAQTQLIQSEKMASIGQLAAGVAHEINNPMGFIYSNMNTLRDYVAQIKQFIERATEAHRHLLAGQTDQAIELTRHLDEWRQSVDLNYALGDIDQLLSETVDGAERVKKIVVDLRTFSRMEEKEKTTADINQGIESTINVCWNELKYHCQVVKELGDIPDLVCYPMKLNQVFMNLIINAAHAIKEKGTVTVRSFRDGNDICVQVDDTGCGIPKENLGRIFDPFFTTKPVGKGTGLGLSIAYNIVKEHQGSITVESEVGKGTTFTVRLPIGEARDA